MPDAAASSVAKPLRKRIVSRIEDSTKRLTVRPLGLLLGPPRAPRPPAGPRAESVRSVLFLRHDGIGDMVLSTPMWRTLKARRPEIRTGIVASARNLSVVAHDPDVDHLYECSSERLPELLRAARETRRVDWDVVLPLLYFKRTKMAFLCKLFAPRALSSMVLMEANSPERYAHLFSMVVPTAYRPSADLMLDLMREHFERTFELRVADEEWRPSLRPDERALASIGSSVAALLSADGTSGYVQVHLEAKDAFHELGLAGSLELSRRLSRRRRDLSFLWTATPAAAPAARRLLASSPLARVHFQPTTSVHELIGVVRGAALVISPDTSVVHVAAAERRPLVGLYEHLPHQWRPSHQPSAALAPPPGAPVSAIPVEAIVDAALGLLDGARVARTTPFDRR